MPQVMEPMYCSQQILIPPTFPHVLKVFAKAAIRTQPYDLLGWSAAYFRALAAGAIPPAKERLEYPLHATERGLTPGFLKLIIRQFSGTEDIESDVLKQRWSGICLDENELKEILCVAGVYKMDNFPLYKFVAVAAGFLNKSLTQTMITLCELYTEEPDGGSAAISADLFVVLYTFLAPIDASVEVTFYDGFLKGSEPKCIKEESAEDIAESKPEYSAETVDIMSVCTPGELSEAYIAVETILEKTEVDVDVLAVPSINITKKRKLKSKNEIEESEDIPSSEEASEDSSENGKESNEGKQQKDEEDEGAKVDNQAKDEIEDVAKDEGDVQVGNESKGEDGDEAKADDEVKGEGESKNENETGDDEGDEGAAEAKTGDVVPPEGTDTAGGDDHKEELEEESHLNPSMPPQRGDVSLQIYSEEGDQIDSLSAMSMRGDDGFFSPPKTADEITIQEMADIANEIQKVKDEKVKSLNKELKSIENLVDKTNDMEYDLGVMRGRQMTLTSGEFIAENLKKEILNKVTASDDEIEVEKLKSSIGSLASTMAATLKMHEVKFVEPPEVILVNPQPGIGRTVAPEMIDEFLRFVKETAAEQCDMFMPRDIRHCLCPPMELA